jgi:fumarate reductase subunit C
MFILKFNDLTTETFDEKTKMFKSVFFSTSSSIELDDILRSFYFRFIECSFSITKREMLKIIKRIAFDKISSFDEIINKLFKICVFIMMQLLTLLFIVCIQQTYHSKAFKKVNIITLKKVDKKDYTISKTYRSIALLNIIEKSFKVHHEQKDFMNIENASIIVRHVHEMSKESINWNDFETFHWTDSHRMKTENESNDYFVEFKRNERFSHDVTCQIDTRHEKEKNFELNHQLN